MDVASAAGPGGAAVAPPPPPHQPPPHQPPVVTIPGATTIAVKVGPAAGARPPGGGVPTGSSSPPTDQEGHILIRVHVPELNVQKCLQFPREELVWDVKQQCLAALPKELKESFNYGLFCPPVNGKAGKFLDEERRLADYPFSGPVGYLELKYKRRVYKMVNLDEKQLKALHTRANLRRLLDYVANGQVEKVAKMCSKGLDPNFHCPETGETPLTVAACTRSPSRVIVALVNGGALLDFRTKDGSTAMHRAVERNSFEAVKTLLDLGASPNYRDSRGLTPLYIAVAGVHHPPGAPVVHASSAGGPSSAGGGAMSSPGPPAAHHGAHHGPSHPNSVPPNSGPADAMLCEALLHDHALLGAQDLQGWQEVHQACRNGLVQHLEHLLFYGADTEARNASGNTPLHVCAVDNRESCARLLLFRGADPNALNYANQTPYQVAVIAGNLELAEIIRSHRPESVVPFREPPRYNPKRRRSGFPPTSSASSYTISEHQQQPTPPPLPRTQSDSFLENPSSMDPPLLPIPPPSTLLRASSSSHHHHHHQTASTISTAMPHSANHHPAPPPAPSVHHHQRGVGAPPSPSPSNRSLPPFSSASSSLSEASSTGSAATGSTVTDKSLDSVSDSSGVGTSNSGGSSSTGGASVSGGRGGEGGGGVTFEAGTTSVVCIEDYGGTLPGHLPIARGDIIEVTGATDCGLLEGTLHGSSGLFPTHCVQEVRPGMVLPTASHRASRVRGRRENSTKHFATAPRLKKQLPAEPRTVILHRARRGFGFVLRGAKATSPLMELTPSERCPALQYLDDVDAGGVADMAGLRKGDFLLAINDEDVSQASHEHVVDLIRRSRDLVTMTVVSGVVGPVGPGGVPGALSGALSSGLPASGACRSGSQTLPSRQYSTLPRKMTGGGAIRTPAPLPPRRDPKTTLSVGRARARSMVAGLSEYEATSRHGRKPSSTEEGEDEEDEEEEEGDEEEGEEGEVVGGGGKGDGGPRRAPRMVNSPPLAVPPNSTFVPVAPHPTSTATLMRHNSSGASKTPPLPQSPPPVGPVLPRTPPPGAPKTASIRSRPTSSRITAAELEELFARQGSPVEGGVPPPPTANGVIPNRQGGLCHTLGARGSPPTPKVYASVAEMKRSKDKGGRYRAGSEVLRMLHKAFHSTPDLVASKGQASPCVGPKSRSQDDIPPRPAPPPPARLYQHSWRSLERLAPPGANATRSLPRRSAPPTHPPPPPNHPPPPPPANDANYASPAEADPNQGAATNDPNTVMSSFRPAEGAKLYASPEDVKTVAYRVPHPPSSSSAAPLKDASVGASSTLRRRGGGGGAGGGVAKARSQSLPPPMSASSAAAAPAARAPAPPMVPLVGDPEQSACTSFRPDSGAATPVGEGSEGPLRPSGGTNPYAQPYHHQQHQHHQHHQQQEEEALVDGEVPEWSGGGDSSSGEGRQGGGGGKGAAGGVVRYMATGSDGSGPPIPEPDYSLSESEGEGGGEGEGSSPPPPVSAPAPSLPPPPPAETPHPSSPHLKDLLVQKVAERQGRLTAGASVGNGVDARGEEGPAAADSNGEGGREQSPPLAGAGAAASSSLPHSFSVEEIQKVRTQLKSSKSYPSDFLLEDGDNSSSGVSSDQDVQNDHPPAHAQLQHPAQPPTTATAPAATAATTVQTISIQQEVIVTAMTLSRRGGNRGGELVRRGSQEEGLQQAPLPGKAAPVVAPHHQANAHHHHHGNAPVRVVNCHPPPPDGDGVAVAVPVIVVEASRASPGEGAGRRREEGGSSRRGAGGTLTKNAVSLVKLPPPMETDGEGAETVTHPRPPPATNNNSSSISVGPSPQGPLLAPSRSTPAAAPLPSSSSVALGGAGHRSSERSIEESLRLIKRHADMLNLTDFSRVVPPPPEFGGGRGGRAASEDDLAAVLAPPPEFSDLSSGGGGGGDGHHQHHHHHHHAQQQQHRTTIRVVGGRKSGGGGGTRSDGEGSQKVYVTKVKAKGGQHHHLHHAGAVQEGRVTTVRIVGAVPKGAGGAAAGEGGEGGGRAASHHRPK